MMYKSMQVLEGSAFHALMMYSIIKLSILCIMILVNFAVNQDTDLKGSSLTSSSLIDLKVEELERCFPVTSAAKYFLQFSTRTNTYKMCMKRIKRGRYHVNFAVKHTNPKLPCHITLSRSMDQN